LTRSTCSRESLKQTSEHDDRTTTGWSFADRVALLKDRALQEQIRCIGIDRANLAKQISRVEGERLLRVAEKLWTRTKISPRLAEDNE
jgi:hypothetical protein